MSKILKLTLTIDPEGRVVASTLQKGKDTECPECKHRFEDFEDEEELTEKEKEDA